MWWSAPRARLPVGAHVSASLTEEDCGTWGHVVASFCPDPEYAMVLYRRSMQADRIDYALMCAGFIGEGIVRVREAVLRPQGGMVLDRWRFFTPAAWDAS